MCKFFACVLFISLFCGASFGGVFSGGSGTSLDPYLISTASDFAAINSNPFFNDRYFLLTADIDMSGYTLEPIGTVSLPFTGSFNGNGFTISSITISSYDVDYRGIFGCIGTGGQIRNLKVSNITINAPLGTYIGVIVGHNSGNVVNCTVSSSSVTGANGVGGISGSNLGQIRYCDVNDVTITGESGVGGITGYCRKGYIYSCSVVATINGGDFAGGIAGSQDLSATIFECDANVSVHGDSYVAGIVGFSSDSCITDCSSTGQVGGSLYIGGIVGFNSDCYVTGSTSNAVVTGGCYVGGIAGYNRLGTIKTTTSYCVVSGIQDVDQFIGTNMGGIFIIAQDLYDVADLNRDGVIDDDDLFYFMSEWLLEGDNMNSDLNQNGIVNYIDFGMLANYR